MKKNTLLTLSLFAALFISSCSPENDNSQIPEKPETPVIKESTVMVMDTTTVSKSLQSIDENGILSFNGLPNNETPKVDDIICSAPTDNAPYGFLYRVAKVSTKDGNTIIETQETSLEEAIENADVSETISLDNHITGVFDEEGNPLEYTSSPEELRAGVASKTTIKIGKTFNNGITLEGNLTINNELQFEMNINDWDLQYLKLAYTAEVELKATVSGEMKAKGNWFVKVASIKLAPITILVAGVPVVITPEIPINLRGELSGTIKGEFTLFDSKNSITAGILYQNDKVNGIFEKKSSESQSIANRSKVSLSGEFKAIVEPGVSFLLYNSRNASVGVTVGIYGKATLTLLNNNEMQIIEELAYDRRYALNPNFKISVGVEGGVNAKLKIFALKLLDFKATQTMYEMELLRGSVFPQFTDISISDKTDNSAKAIATIQTPANFNFIFPVSQYGICISQIILPTIGNSDWYNILGPLPSIWSPVSTPVVSADFVNLQAGTTYYICPYFINMFGTFYGKVMSFSLEKPKIELSSPANGAKLTIGEPVDVSFYVSSFNDVTGNYLPFPDRPVNFETQGEVNKPSVVSDINGLVTVQWTPKNENDVLTAKLVDKDGQTISEATFTPELEEGECEVCESCDWVEINGVKWATRNVGAANPEDYGGYYTWEEAQAFHPPTLAQIESLTNMTYVKYEWTTRNGVYGGKFTDRKSGNCIFLPAAGWRYYSGSLDGVGSYGYYWSSTEDGSKFAYFLGFRSDSAYAGSYYETFGRCVRCVSE